jgi:hypothetical protein
MLSCIGRDAKLLLQEPGIQRLVVDYLAAELSSEDASLGSRFNEQLALGNIEKAAAMLAAGLVWVRTRRLYAQAVAVQDPASTSERPDAVSSPEGQQLILLAHQELVRCCGSQYAEVSSTGIGSASTPWKEAVATPLRGLTDEKELVYVLCDWTPEENAPNKLRVRRGQRILVSLSTDRGWSYGEILVSGGLIFLRGASTSTADITISPPFPIQRPRLPPPAMRATGAVFHTNNHSRIWIPYSAWVSSTRCTGEPPKTTAPISLNGGLNTRWRDCTRW